MKDLLQDFLVEGLNKLVQGAGKALNAIGKELLSMFSEIFKTGNLPENSKVLKVDAITQKELVKIAKDNMVANCNEVVAMKSDTDNGGCIIYLAYSKDRNLLPQDKNFYIVINAEESTKTIDALFSENELVILK